MERAAGSDARGVGRLCGRPKRAGQHAGRTDHATANARMIEHEDRRLHLARGDRRET